MRVGGTVFDKPVNGSVVWTFDGVSFMIDPA